MAQLQQDIAVNEPERVENVAEKLNVSIRIFDRVGSKALLELTGQLSLMLRTGTTLTDSLSALCEQTDSERLHEVLEKIENDLSGGASLAKALSGHPKIFDEFFVNTVEAGESSGQLALVFSRLESYLRKKLELRSKIVTALIYPSIIATVALGAVSFIVTFVLPRFIRIFEKAGVELPAPTRMLLAISGFVSNYWYLVLAAVVIAPVTVYFIMKVPRTKRLLDTLFLHIPGVGPLVIMIQSSQLLRTLGTMLEAGVPLVESLQVTRRVCRNHHFGKLVDEILRRVTQGEPMRIAFNESEIISPAIKTMISTGERTGALPEVMTSVSNYLDEDSDRRLKRLSATIEPLIIVAMGVVVGFIAISILLPLFRLGAAVGGSA